MRNYPLSVLRWIFCNRLIGNAFIRMWIGIITHMCGYMGWWHLNLCTIPEAKGSSLYLNMNTCRENHSPSSPIMVMPEFFDGRKPKNTAMWMNNHQMHFYLLCLIQFTFNFSTIVSNAPFLVVHTNAERGHESSLLVIYGRWNSKLLIEISSCDYHHNDAVCKNTPYYNPPYGLGYTSPSRVCGLVCIFCFILLRSFLGALMVCAWFMLSFLHISTISRFGFDWCVAVNICGKRLLLKSQSPEKLKTRQIYLPPLSRPTICILCLLSKCPRTNCWLREGYCIQQSMYLQHITYWVKVKGQAQTPTPSPIPSLSPPFLYKATQPNFPIDGASRPWKSRHTSAYHCSCPWRPNAKSR